MRLPLRNRLLWLEGMHEMVLRLSLKRPAPFTRDTFVPGASNAEALSALDAWPRWPGTPSVDFAEDCFERAR
jgi:chromosomal replication initiation ATPase DnaA